MQSSGCNEAFAIATAIHYRLCNLWNPGITNGLYLHGPHLDVEVGGGVQKLERLRCASEKRTASSGPDFGEQTQ